MDKYIVYYRKRDKDGIGTAEHTNRKEMSEKEFRLALINEYNSRKRKVIKIEKIINQVS